MPKRSNRKNDTRRVNRDRRQRLEELRRQQRAAERRKNLLFAGSAIAIAVILIGAAVIPTWLHDRAKSAKLKVGYQATPTALEKSAGCLGVHNDPISATAIHVPNKPIDYAKQRYGDTKGNTPALPPSSGPHNPIPLGGPSRFFPLSENPRPERAVHNLEHGYVVVWYDAKLPAADVQRLQALAKDPSLNELVVVGWTRGDLPLGKHVVLTTWGRTDRCGTVSSKMVTSYYQQHVNKLAPEVGAGAMNGAQYPPNDLNTLVAPPSPAPSAAGSANASPSTAASPSASSRTSKKPQHK